MIKWAEKYHGASGMLPELLSAHDPRSAAEQLQETYAHGGGWRPFKGFTFTWNEDPIESTLKYPRDPTLHPVAYTQLRDETLILFEHSWLVIVQGDKTKLVWEVARLD